MGVAGAKRNRDRAVRVASAIALGLNSPARMQFNKHHAAKLHVDKNNLGPPYMHGLGDYEGRGYEAHVEEGVEGVEEGCRGRKRGRENGRT